MGAEESPPEPQENARVFPNPSVSRSRRRRAGPRTNYGPRKLAKVTAPTWLKPGTYHPAQFHVGAYLVRTTGRGGNDFEVIKVKGNQFFRLNCGLKRNTATPGPFDFHGEWLHFDEGCRLFEEGTFK